jgi:PIN domain nuclease of toxin-antitoxin system
VAAGRLDWNHRDPFDRMLVAQAMGEELMMVTAARMIRRAGVPTLW